MLSFLEESRRCWALPPAPALAHPCCLGPGLREWRTPQTRAARQAASRPGTGEVPLHGKAQGEGPVSFATSFLPGKLLPSHQDPIEMSLVWETPQVPATRVDLQIAPSLSSFSTQTALIQKGKAYCSLGACHEPGCARCLAASTPHWILCVTCSQFGHRLRFTQQHSELSRFSCVADGGAVSSGHGSSWLPIPPAQGVSASISPSDSKAPKGRGCVPGQLAQRQC